MIFHATTVSTTQTDPGNATMPYTTTQGHGHASTVTGITGPAHAASELSDGLMSDLIYKLTVNQFCSVIRQHDIDPEAATMLGMLESLVTAGEIPLANFMQRVRNLLPHIFSRIDPQLLAKLTAAAAD